MSAASFAVLACGSAQAATHVPPMPTVTPPIPVTDTSKPWLYYKLLQRPLDLDGAGFVEEEFFVSGKGNVYDWGPANATELEVRYRDAPYTTRILMRRPSDLSKFSGNVYVEVMNPARGYDLPIFFSYMADRMLENGDAWVGVTTGQNVAGLKRYDPLRYAPIQMTNPAPANQWACPPPPAPAPTAGQGGGQGGQPAAAPPPPPPLPIENGLRFDMLSQLSRWLKSEDPSNPLAAGEVDFVYMVSHTGGDVATYTASVAREARQPDGGPIYDGYVIKTGSGVGALRNCGSGPPQGVFDGTLGKLPGAPVVQVKMQGDVPNQRRPPSDDPNDTHRMYEVVGTAHADRWPYRYLPLNRELRKAIDIANDTNRGVVTDIYPYAHACNVEGAVMNDFPLPYVISGVLANLDAFKRNGTPMPRTEPIRTAGETARSPVLMDEHGNALGGLRTVWVDAPTRTYYAHVPGSFSTCYDMGYSVAWPWAKMQAVYGGYQNWARRANASIDKMIADRIVTRSDGEKIRRELVLPVSAASLPVPLVGDRIATSRGDLVIRPVTHASFLMQWNGKTIYVDPTGGGEPYINLPRPDLIVLTDIHGDHVHAPTLTQIGAGAPAVAPAAVRDALPANIRGMVTTVLANGQSTVIDGVRIEAVPMYNTTPERTELHPKGRGNGYVMTFGDKRVYIAGDTEPTPEMLALKDIDVAFLPMNQPFTMTPQQAADAVKAFKPKVVYPYHSRGTDVGEFARLVGTDSGVEVRLRRWY